MWQRIRNKELWLVFGIAVIVRAIALPFAQTVDADAVTRTHMAITWLNNPHLITDGIWAPLHQYINAVALTIIPDQVWGPPIFHALFGALLVIPIFKLARRSLDPGPGMLVALFISFAPVVFRNSFHALSGIPALFFLAYSMYWAVIASGKGSDWKSALYAGLFITIAAGLRYESWVVMAIFLVLLAIKGRWKNTLIFALAAGIFPLFWMIGNYVERDNAFYFLEGSRLWNMGAEDNNSWLPPHKLILRRIFFTYSLLLNVTPWVFGAILVGAVLTWKRIRWKSELWIFCIPLVVLLVIFTSKAVDGSLFTQHRFTSLLILFMAPITILALQCFSWTRLRIIGPLCIAGMFVMSFVWQNWKIDNWFSMGDFRTAIGSARVWTTNQLEAIPRIPSNEPDIIVDYITANLQAEETLILDFLEWRETYYIALCTRLPRKEIYIVPGGKKEAANFARLRNLLIENNTKSGIFVRSIDSKLPLGDVIDLGEGLLLNLTLQEELEMGGIYTYTVTYP